MTNLVHPIEGASFGILKKELLEDDLTVSLRTFIPENIDNCEIREVGIYETVGGVDHLFAIGTQQPLIKPSENLRYFISVDYYVFLKSQNLAEIYDQIVLLPDDQLITKEDLENLMSTILFTESNLIEQINGNSRVIGLNRPEQLKVKIDRSMEAFGFTAAANIYSILMSYVKSDSIYAYWLFDYSQRLASQTGVTDIGIHGRNLSSNKALNLYDKIYQGVLPSLIFDNSDYYYLSQDKSTATYNPNVFTIVGAPIINPEGVANSFNENSYITATSLSSATTNSTAVQFKFSLNTSSTSQSIMFTSNAYSMEAYFDSSDGKLKVRLGNGISWILTLSTDVEIIENYTVQIAFNGNLASLSFLEDGVFVTKDTQLIASPIVTTFGLITLGAPNGSLSSLQGTIDLKEVAIRINGVQTFSGSVYTSQNSMSLTNEEQTKDESFVMLFTLNPLEEGDRTLLARSNYSTNSHIFEINETDTNSFQVKLFTDKNNYLTFYTSDGKVPTIAHSVVIGYDADKKDLSAYIGGHKVFIHKAETGTYTHMNDAPFVLKAFTYTDLQEVYSDNLTNPSRLYNADGTAYTGDEWTIANNQIMYNSNPISYSNTSINTKILYAWGYNDGISTFKIYTDTLDIAANTTLYNEDYTRYTGSSFSVVQSGSSYIIQYNGHNTSRTSPDIPSKVLYKYYYLGGIETIWANSSSSPTILYTAKNTLYTGTDWTIVDDKVYYQTHEATYNSLYDYTVPTLPVTSYIINSSGVVDKNINSAVSVISVIRDYINEEGLRSLSLNLEAAIGNNPCTTVY